MDHKGLSEIFQEIMDEFSGMKPTSLDRLEDKALDAIHKLGSCLMDTKLREWNDEVHQEREETCGSWSCHCCVERPGSMSSQNT